MVEQGREGEGAIERRVRIHSSDGTYFPRESLPKIVIKKLIKLKFKTDLNVPK